MTETHDYNEPEEGYKTRSTEWLDEAFSDPKPCEGKDPSSPTGKVGCLLVAVVAIVIIFISICSLVMLDVLEGLA